MSFKEKFKKLAAAAGYSVTDNSTDAKRFAEKKQRAQALESAAITELARLKKENFDAEADNFIAAEIKAGRMFPAERKTFKSLFVQAATDDDARPLASGSRLDNLKTVQEKREPHRFTEELLDPERRK